MFCKYCGKQINDNSDFCCMCGKKITNSDSTKNANVHTQTTSKLFGKVGSTFSQFANEIQKGIAQQKINAENFEQLKPVINDFVDTLTNDEILLFLNLYSIGNSREFVIAALKNSKQNIPSTENANIFFNKIVNYISDNDRYKNYMISDTDNEENKKSNKIYQEILDRIVVKNYNNLCKTYSDGKNLKTILNKDGLEYFYTSTNKMFISYENRGIFSDYETYFKNFDKNTISEVREWLFPKEVDKLKEIYVPDNNLVHNIIMKDGTKVLVWRSEDTVCFISCNLSLIKTKEQLNNMMDYNFRKFNISDIESVTEHGNYSEREVISSDSTMDLILSRKHEYKTVVTDTRYISLETNNSNYDFCFSEIDKFRQILPEVKFILKS